MRKIISILVFGIFFCAEAFAQTLVAKTSRTDLPEGEAFLLTLDYDGSDASVPELGVLDKDFTIYSVTNSYQTNIVNGQVSQQRQWQIGLVPKGVAGTAVTVPPIKLGNIQSNPVQLRILDAQNLAHPDNSDNPGYQEPQRGYPTITLSGTLGWTNNSGMGIKDPGKILWSAAASLLQPIFNANANRARVKIAKAQQEETKLAFQQALLNAGAEVNNALTQCQSARAKADLRVQQIEALERAVESTELLMKHSSTTYLEVLTAQQSLLSAQLSQIADRFDEIQGVVNLYQALGGGRDMAEEAK